MFFEVPYRSVIVDYLLDEIENRSDWSEHHEFDALFLPNDHLLNDKFLKWLYEKHSFKAAVLKVKPFVCYDWHIDTNRGVSVNMLLSHGSSHCLFSNNRGGTTFNFEELAYQPYRYYLFNNQIQHAVFNFDQPRFLFSLEFDRDKHKLSYSDLLLEVQSFQYFLI